MVQSVYLYGLIRAEGGVKMRKTKGNVQAHRRAATQSNCKRTA
jgi:valyl-tRNA synthetase